MKNQIIYRYRAANTAAVTTNALLAYHRIHGVTKFQASIKRLRMVQKMDALIVARLEKESNYDLAPKLEALQNKFNSR